MGLRPRQRQTLWPGLITDDRWREPIRLAAEAAVSDNTLTCEDFLEELLELAAAAETNPSVRLAASRLAAESLWDLGQSGRTLLEKKLQNRIITNLADVLGEEPITNPPANLLKERVVAGQVLGHLGDPRTGVATLPPLLTPPIKGKFEYGPDKTAQETPPFRAGVYPVTNAQFKLFMGAGGYTTKEWWSAAGWQWCQGKPKYDWQKMD